MDLSSISNDLVLEMFKFLDIQDLESLYKTNKTLNYDVEKYSNQKFKQSWTEVLKQKKCIHCNNLCENEYDKICENCTCDTCWNCFSKVGSENLCIDNCTNVSTCEEYTIFTCIDKCKFNCSVCKKTFNKNNITIDTKTYKKYCNLCFNHSL